MSSFDQQLEASVNGQTFVVENVGGCLMLEDIRDFNADGYSDALVNQVQACGGNAVGNTRFFVFYDGQTFRHTEAFGYSWNDSTIDPWENGWSVTTTDQGTDEYGDERIITERTILKEGQAVLVESHESQELPTLIEIRAKSFESDPLTPQTLSFNLDSSDPAETITCEYWDRWGSMMCNTTIAGNYIDLGNCLRIGVLPSQTNGMQDLVCGDEKVLSWQNGSYQ